MKGDVGMEESRLSGSAGVTRRGFVAGAAAATAVAGLGGRAALADGAAQPQARKPLTPGTYTGEAKGFGGYVVMQVTVSEDAITDIQFVENRRQESVLVPSEEEDPNAHYAWMVREESPQVLNSALSRLPQRIIDAQSVGVDAVCGATFSSFAIKSAVADCIEQAGGDLGEWEAEPEKSDAEEDLGEFDVIVVGGGSSGVAAAARAADLGAKVALFEKSGRVGGSGALSTGPCSIGAQIQKDAGLEGDALAYAKSMMQENHWSVDGNLMLDFFRRSGHTIDWMIEKGGFDFAPLDYRALDPDFGQNLVAYTTDSTSGTEVTAAWTRLAGLADTVEYEADVDEVLQDADGAVCGVKATRWDGSRVTASAKAVVFACGGFGGSREMQVRYNKHYYPLFGLTQNTGTTLSLLLPLGAQLEHPTGEEVHYTDVVGELPEDEFDEFERNAFYSLQMCPTFMRVNTHGQRFHDENERSYSLIAHCANETHQGDHTYLILSQAQVETLKEQGIAGTGYTYDNGGICFIHYMIPCDHALPNMEAMLAAAEEAGFAYSGATAEELSQKAGFAADVFAESLEQYEQACETGVDEVFGKDAAWLFPMGEEGPYYAVQCDVRPYCSMGGVKVDAHMRVLDTDDQVIKGAYAAGTDSLGAIMDGVFYANHFGIALGWAINSGYAAGEHAVLDAAE